MTVYINSVQGDNMNGTGIPQHVSQRIMEYNSDSRARLSNDVLSTIKKSLEDARNLLLLGESSGNISFSRRDKIELFLLIKDLEAIIAE